MASGYTDWMIFYDTYNKLAQDLESRLGMTEFGGTIAQFNSLVSPVYGCKLVVKMVYDIDTTSINQIGLLQAPGGTPAIFDAISYGNGGANIRSPNDTAVNSNATIRVLYKLLTSDHLTAGMLTLVKSYTLESGSLANIVDDNNGTYFQITGDNNGLGYPANTYVQIDYPFAVGDIFWLRRSMATLNANGYYTSLTITDDAGRTLHNESSGSTGLGTATKDEAVIHVGIQNATSYIRLRMYANVSTSANYVRFYEADVITVAEQV